MKYLRFTLMIVLFAAMLCVGAQAVDKENDGINNLKIVNTATTSITVYEADGTTVIPPSTTGNYLNAARYSITYSAALAGKDYIILVLSGTDTTPTTDNILYIDQATAGSNYSVTFNVYPKEITSGGTIYLSSETGLIKLASYSHSIFTVSLSDETVMPGGTVSVDVDLLNNPGIGAISLYIYYDPALLTYSSFTSGNAWTYHKTVTNFGGQNSTEVNATTESAVGITDGDGVNENIVAISLVTDRNILSDGNILKMKFTAAQVAAAIDTELGLFCSKSANNENPQVGIYTLTDGSTVMIRLYTKGDIDNDTYFTASDALMALQISVGTGNYTDMQRLAADVDGEPPVTASDALMILQRSVGLSVDFR